jgi:heme/copper-type cytochrome/quinol oxidase subunit 3
VTARPTPGAPPVQAPVDRRRVLDVSMMPDSAFGHQGLIWWGTVGFMVIEGAMFVIALVVYFYLRLKVETWPPSAPDPDPVYGTANLILVLVSVVPAAISKKAAESCELGKTRAWLAVLTLMGVTAVVLRAYEYTTLNCRWDDNAYGSIVWVLLSLHTIHVATDVVDSAVLLVMAFMHPMTRKRYVDLSENSLYWYFIVAWWIPIYVVIYWAPRFL